MRSDKGFTLVELVIVIAVIAVISTVLVVSFAGIIGDANDVKSQAESNQSEKLDYVGSILDYLEGAAPNAVPDETTTAYTEADNAEPIIVECGTEAELLAALSDESFSGALIKLTADITLSNPYKNDVLVYVKADSCTLDVNGNMLKIIGDGQTELTAAIVVDKPFTITDSVGDDSDLSEKDILISNSLKANAVFKINADLFLSDIFISYESKLSGLIFFDLDVGALVLQNTSFKAYYQAVPTGLTFTFLDGEAGSSVKITDGSYYCSIDQNSVVVDMDGSIIEVSTSYQNIFPYSE